MSYGGSIPRLIGLKEAESLATQVRHSLSNQAAFSSCSQPWVTGCRITVNSLFNGWRMKDV